MLASALGFVLAGRESSAHASSGGSAITSGTAKTGGASKHPRPPGNPFAGRAMWIWQLGQVDGGNVSAIIATAHQYGIGTLMIKSSDGISFWSSQFTPQLVSELRRGGLKVCAWQYVYGNHPVTEAYMGADAVKDGADCLLIDAEVEYQGKYVSAQTYIQRLRKLIGNRFPVGLAGFPYIDYHPGFPYSVFLGPRGAQYNVPQMYWKDIGATVDDVFAHTYSYNAIYGRPIYPLGQVYNSPPGHQIVRFRELSRIYGASGVSWWTWQEASSSQWAALSRPVGTVPGYVPNDPMASIGQGALGDLVVWAQEHLVSAGYAIPIDGDFATETVTAVQDFQAAHGLMVDGIIGPDTWAALLRYAPAAVIWGGPGMLRRPVAHMAFSRAPHSRAPRSPLLREPVPESASRAQTRNELAGAGGAGRPPAR